MILIDRTLLASTPAAWLDGLSVVPFDAPTLPGDFAPAVRGLLLRSTTRVGSQELRQMPGLRVVSTASSGRDHLDEQALHKAKVVVGHGRGGNAEAVVDYVVWALSRTLLHSDRDLDAAVGEKRRSGSWLKGRRVIVLGCGAVGARVRARLLDLGAEVVCSDPPRARREVGFESVSLDQALSLPADALTLHVPLTHSGRDRTAGLVNAERIAALGAGILINAARGGVLDEQAAISARAQGKLSGLIIDTFEGEPEPLREVMDGCDLVTPHVAGHSLEGKLRVSWLAIATLREALGLPPPPALLPELRVLRSSRSPNDLAFQPFRVLDTLSERFRDGEEAGGFRSLRAAHLRYELAS